MEGKYERQGNEKNNNNSRTNKDENQKEEMKGEVGRIQGRGGVTVRGEGVRLNYSLEKV